MNVLDFGCGANKVQGAFGVDRIQLPGVDLVADVRENTSLTLPSNSFDEIYALDTIEHVDSIPWTLAELHRVAKPNALLHLRYPHWSCSDAKNDATHEHQLGLRAFDHFDPATPHGKKYRYYQMYRPHFPFKIEARRIEHYPQISYVTRAALQLFSDDVYEKFFASTIPIGAINLDMRVLK